MKAKDMQTIFFDGMTIPVADVNRSADFYEQLGFTVEQKHSYFALLRMNSTTLGLLYVKTLNELPLEMRRNIHIEFSTDDVDSLYTELQAKGMEFYQPPKDHKWERNMAVYDPDGYRVEFAQGVRGENVPPAH